jgi:Ca2+-binding EF-hand superfamily protein
MQYLSKFTPDMPVPPPYDRPPLLSTFEEDQVKELAFKVGAEVIDAIVPDLAPDLFRMIDINNDGTISAEEWKKAQGFIKNPEPRSMIDLVFKLLDKDCSGTVEREEVFGFVKKLINMAFRTTKNVLPLITKTVSTVMSCEAAEQVFELLDGDGDGKLTPEEITNNFCGQILLGVNAASSAAPLLNQIRARDHEIAYLKSKIAQLEGNTDDYVPLQISGFETNFKEFFDVFNSFRRSSRDESLFGEDSAACRAGMMKLEAVGMKLLVITLMTLAEIPCLKEHDKDSFFNENETAALKFHQEVVDILRLVIKVAPKGDVILRMMDTVLEKAAVGEFRKERKIFTDALFDFIDMNKDGKITPAEYAVYTDLFVKMSFDDDGAKAKLMAVFASLDLDKSGCLSKDELSAFVIKLFEVTVALILLLVTYAEVAVLELSDKAIRELMDFYIKYRVEYDFMKPEDLQKIDIREFNIMCKHPQWVEEYCKDVLKGHQKVMKDGGGGGGGGYNDRRDGGGGGGRW